MSKYQIGDWVFYKDSKFRQRIGKIISEPIKMGYLVKMIGSKENSYVPWVHIVRKVVKEDVEKLLF